MKDYNQKETLFLLNTSKKDIFITDLGIKVKVGQTIEVYTANKYLTKSQVEKSLNYGDVQNKLQLKQLKVVQKAINKNPKEIIKQSAEGFKITKTKSSVVIENPNIENDGEAFDFADYGVENVSRVKDKEAIFVQQKEDLIVEEKTKITTSPTLQNNLNKQSQVVIETLNKNLTDPMGKVAINKTSNKPFVVSAPQDEIKQQVEKPVKVKIAKEAGSVKVEPQRDQKQKNKKAKYNKVQRADKLEDDQIVLEEVKVAVEKQPVKAKEGHIVMELKE